MAGYREVRFAAGDGLSLYGRVYDGANSSLTPLLCLSGLTRNSKDFEALIPHIAGERRILTMDYRGRGQSSRAEDWNSYRPHIEADDAVKLLDHCGVSRAAILGTSRGGIVAMLMAVAHLDRIAGVLFNDIGPDIETAGLKRIRSYLGVGRVYANQDEAVAALKATNPGYDTLDEAQWLRMARAIFREENGQLVADYDERLSLTFPTLEEIEQGKVPALWDLFGLFSAMPISVLRGEHSDLLSPRIVSRMAELHPALDQATVRDRGHIPLLDEPQSLAVVERWLRRVDQG
jgi:pimeloyl-ACP methyl ester carboxylesterase